MSIAGFVVQITLTSWIHQSMGLTFALLLLPVGFASTAFVILVSGALWAPVIARCLDTTLRYTVDKTTRELLFLPLAADLKYRAKPFIDVRWIDRRAMAGSCDRADQPGARLYWRGSATPASRDRSWIARRSSRQGYLCSFVPASSNGDAPTRSGRMLDARHVDTLSGASNPDERPSLSHRMLQPHKPNLINRCCAPDSPRFAPSRHRSPRSARVAVRWPARIARLNPGRLLEVGRRVACVGPLSQRIRRNCCLFSGGPRARVAVAAATRGASPVGPTERRPMPP